jgi:branched-subunit amino acid aminotransferase/4-amino-4-deoxychorismate lyase
MCDPSPIRPEQLCGHDAAVPAQPARENWGVPPWRTLTKRNGLLLMAGATVARRQQLGSQHQGAEILCGGIGTMVIELDGHPVDGAALSTLALYNYGHFTSMHVSSDGVRGLHLHLSRLQNDCRHLFDHDLDLHAVRDLVRHACRDGNVVVRVTVYAPDLDLGSPGRDVEPHVLVSTRAASSGELPPLRLGCVQYERELPTVKHVGLFSTIAHRRAVQRNGFDDVLFLDRDANITEGATWNIGFVNQDGATIWPEGQCLPGVTMRLLQGAGPFSRTHIDLSLARQMRSAFVTNAAVGVRPVASINDIEYTVDCDALVNLRRAYEGVPEERLLVG